MAFQDATVRNGKSKRVQVDEVWSFTYAKQKNVLTAKAAPQGAGDRGAKLVIQWFICPREGSTAKLFIYDLAGRVNRHRIPMRIGTVIGR